MRRSVRQIVNLFKIPGFKCRNDAVKSRKIIENKEAPVRDLATAPQVRLDPIRLAVAHLNRESHYRQLIQ
jgi:hypothetical protein